MGTNVAGDALNIGGAATTGDSIQIVPGTARTSGAAILITDDSLAAAVTGSLVDINVEGTTDTNTLDITFATLIATGNAIDLNMGTNVAGDAINIGGSATTGDGIEIVPGTARTSGSALLITDASIAATVTGDLIQIDVTGTPDTNTIDIDVSGIATATSNALDITYATVAALGNAIDLNMGTNVAGDALNIDSPATTGNAIEIDMTGATGNAGAIDIATVGVGAANVGAALNIVGTGTLANNDASLVRITTNSVSTGVTASLVDLSSTGNLATAVTDGAVLKITETGAAQATTYAVYISSTSNEALRVDTGLVVFDENLTIATGGLTISAGGAAITGDVTHTNGTAVLADTGTNTSDCVGGNNVTFDLSTGNYFSIDMADASDCSITLTNGTAGGIYLFNLIYSGVNNFTLADTTPQTDLIEAVCADSGGAEPDADSDNVILTVRMTDATSAQILSCAQTNVAP